MLPLQVRQGGAAALAAAGGVAQWSGPCAGLCGKTRREGLRLRPCALRPLFPGTQAQGGDTRWAQGTASVERGVLPELLKHCAELDLPRSMDRLLAGTQPSLLEVRFLTYLRGRGRSVAPACVPSVARGGAHCGHLTKGPPRPPGPPPPCLHFSRQACWGFPSRRPPPRCTSLAPAEGRGQNLLLLLQALNTN